MRLSQILDETLELLIANYEDPRFKSFGDLKKHEYQMSKSEEDKDNRRLMYEGQIGNSEAAKKAHHKKRSKGTTEEINKKAAETRAKWYKSLANREKFMEAIRRRDAKKKAAKISEKKSHQ